MDQVQEVKDKTDIVALVREYVTLTKAGTNYRGNCPFHNEKTPSFMVSPELQIYKCFGCGEGGDVIRFLQQHEGMEFYEALKFLAKRVGVKLKSISPKTSSERELLLEINNLAAKVYGFVLNNHDLGKDALKYFLEKRELNITTIKEFELGYAPERRDFLVNYLTKKKNFKRQDIEKSGLAVNISGSLVDRFRGRIIFPIRDIQGRVIALAGRILPKNDTGKLAKYINSPETLIYSKSKSLYGIDKARSVIKKTGVAILVEGELDMLSSYQAGIKNVVAIKGTALTEEQTRMLSRLARSVVLALDSDFAGDTAAMRGIQLAQTQGLDVRVARTGEHKDPDEFAKADPDGYKQSLKDAVGVWDFILDVVCGREDLSTGSGKAKVSRELVPLFAQIEDKILQAHYVGLLAKKLQVPEEAVVREIENFAKKMTVQTGSSNKISKKEDKTRRQLLEERLVSLAMQSDSKILMEKEIQSLFKSSFIQKIIREFLKFEQKDNFETRKFLGNLPSELRNGFSDLILREQISDDVDIGGELKSVINNLKIVDNKEKREKLSQKIKDSELRMDVETLEDLKESYTKLLEIGKNLELNAK